MNPFMAFSLYVAARVFVEYLKKMPADQEIRQSLEFLLAAMQAIQMKNPLTESFLVQLNMDIEGSGLSASSHNPDSQHMEGMVSILCRFTTSYQITLQLHGSPLTQFQGSTRLPADYGVSKYDCSPIFHFSETSEEGRSPAENLPPEDLRIPKHDVKKGNSAVGIEDPRQQTYAYRGAADFIARETNHSRPYFPETAQSSPHLPQDDIHKKSGALPRRFEKIFPNAEWNQGHGGSLASANALTDSDKINSTNNANTRNLDTEMTDHSANSRGLTPQSSSGYNLSSSNTSYSPSQAHDDDPNASGTGGASSFLPAFAPTPRITSAQLQQDPFKIPAGWDVGTGMTPGQGMTPASMTGMTPDGGWEKLMDSMGWETGRTE